MHLPAVTAVSPDATDTTTRLTDKSPASRSARNKLMEAYRRIVEYHRGAFVGSVILVKGLGGLPHQYSQVPGTPLIERIALPP